MNRAATAFHFALLNLWVVYAVTQIVNALMKICRVGTGVTVGNIAMTI